MPAYNEEENMEQVVRAWYGCLSLGSADSALVVADSGSEDRTHAILQELQTELPQLRILEDTEKQHGPKLMALYAYALEQGADYVFQTDSDGQTDPSEFAGFWQRRERYDAILGHRMVRGDGASRAAVEAVVCHMLRIYFGVKAPDANAPFRLMKAEALRRHLGKLPADYALPNIMLTAFFLKAEEKVLFRGITFRPRQGGTNSINIKRIFAIGRQAVSDFGRFRRENVR